MAGKRSTKKMKPTAKTVAKPTGRKYCGGGKIFCKGGKLKK